MANLIEDKVVYHAADMLHNGLAKYRKEQKEQLDSIIGITGYDPSSDKSINDKKNASSDKLAERIVNNDTKAIENADIYLIDLPTSDAGGRGTVTELGQIYQMKREARKDFFEITSGLGWNYRYSVKDHLYQLSPDFFKRSLFLFEESDEINDTPNFLVDILRNKVEIISRPVIVYSDDLRYGSTNMKEHMDRVPYSFNAYTYGVALDLTEGHGVVTWEKALEILEKLGEEA